MYYLVQLKHKTQIYLIANIEQDVITQIEHNNFYLVKLYTGKYPRDNDIWFIYHSREMLHQPN